MKLTPRPSGNQGDRLFQIWTVKFDGSSRFYQGYDDLKIAEGVRDRLKEIGLPCEIRLAGMRAATRCSNLELLWRRSICYLAGSEIEFAK